MVYPNCLINLFCGYEVGFEGEKGVGAAQTNIFLTYLSIFGV